MLVLLLIGVYLKCVQAQQYPRFFDKEDLKELGFLSTHNNPNPVVKQYYDPTPTTVSRTLAPRPYGRAPGPTKRRIPMKFGRTDENYFGSMMSATPDYRPLRHTSTEDIALLEDRLTKAGKWYEFIEMTDRLKEEYGDRIMTNVEWEEQRKKLAAYSRSLVGEQPKPQSHEPPKQRGLPSPGFQMYWGGDEVQKTPTHNKYQNEYYNDPDFAPPRQYHPRDLPKTISAKQMLEMARQKLQKTEPSDQQFIQPSDQALQPRSQQQKESIVKNNEDAITPPSTNHDVQDAPGLRGLNISYDRFLPKTDDFGSPVRWVPYNSNETNDGLAKVTDPATGKNRHFVMNGMVLVPITDYNILRLGYPDVGSTTLKAPTLTTDSSMLKTIITNMNTESVDDRDWLAFETVLGFKSPEEKCDIEGCQARCHKSGCDSVCLGDTCASGCVGASCNSFCKGPGCFSMCIGEECTAKCEGMSCEARCRGKDCDASCRRFSCQYTVNGAFRIGAGTWEQLYPQYDTKSHGPPGYDPSTPDW